MIETVTETITPEVAEKYLSTSAGNRIIRDIWVDQLVDMMRHGQFIHTHQGIGFNADGTLRDGHHRLRAIVKSRTTQVMQVSRGLSDDAIAATDRGRARDVSDNARMGGHEWMSRPVVAAGRLWLELLGNRKPSDPAIVEFCIENRTHIQNALSLSEFKRGNTFRHASIIVMLALASQTGNLESLDGWFQAFSKGVVREEWQTSATCLREWWIRNSKLGGSKKRIQLCHRIYGSMRAWIDRRPLGKCYEAAVIDWLTDTDADPDFQN